MVFVGGGVYYVLSSGAEGSGAESYGDALWVAWKSVTAGDDSPDEDHIPRFVNVIMVIMGMIVMATLFGLIDETMRDKVDELKKGKSAVLEDDHSIILGWNDKVLPILEQLALANESDNGKAIVIMADLEKEDMDERVAESDLDMKGSEVVTRSGSSIIVGDLAKLSIQTARSIIVLTDAEASSDEADAMTIRCCLALTAFGDLAGHVVVELCDVDNVDVLRIGVASSGHNLIPLVAHDIIGRLMIQCARQPGLAFVFSDILQFDGSEIYVKEWPDLVGKTFEYVAYSFEAAVALGVKRAEFMADGSHIMLNPPQSYEIEEGDEIICLAEDDDSYDITPLVRPLPPPPRQLLEEDERVPESILFCGWRRDLEDMLTELDKWVAKGSRLTLLSGIAVDERESMMGAARNSKGAEGERSPFNALENLSIHHVEGNPVLRNDLLKLPMIAFDSVIILSDETWEGDGMSCDSRVLVAMLLCKDILRKLGRDEVPIVSEILDPRTKQLVSLSGCSDYVVSSELISMCLAQCSENRDMEYILASIFSEEGSEMHVKDARFFADEGEVLTFWEIQKRATDARDENNVGTVVFGYKQASDDDFLLNPPDKNVKMTWKSGDLLAVISED